MKIYLMKFSKGLLLISLLFLSLASCRDEDEEMEFVPGNQLFISGSSEVYAGAEGVRYLVDNNTLNADYVWSISGDAILTEDADNDGFVYIDFPGPGTYELAVSNGTAEGNMTINVLSKVVSLGVTSASGSEFSGTANDTIRVPIKISDTTYANSFPTSARTSIFYSVEGSATAGDDYQVLSANPLILPAGFDADTTINIRLLDDMIAEENDSIIVRIISIETDDENSTATVLTDSIALTQYIFHIMDDLKIASFEEMQVDTLSNSDDAGNYVFNVILSGPANSAVTVPYTVAGTGVSPNAGELLFTKGTISQPLTISLSAAAFASDQEIVISLGEPISDDEEVTFDLDDDDMPTGNEMTIVIDVED